jgi:secreted trypsin-like serine protease
VAVISASAAADDPFPFQFCAGVVIGDRRVATAAHCVATASPEGLAVIIDADNLCHDRPIDGTRAGVTAVDIDPRYDRNTQAYDVAVLTVDTPAAISVRTVLAGESVRDEEAVALGWGRGSPAGVPPCRLQRADLTLIEPEGCLSRLAAAVGYRFDRESMRCAVPVDGGRDTCAGDSGGPLLLGRDVEYSPVIGLVSWGRGCASGIPGVYARMDGWVLEGNDGVDP